MLSIYKKLNQTMKLIIYLKYISTKRFSKIHQVNRKNNNIKKDLKKSLSKIICVRSPYKVIDTRGSCVSFSTTYLKSLKCLNWFYFFYKLDDSIFFFYKNLKLNHS